MSGRTLRRIPLNHLKPRKPVTGRPRKISVETRRMIKKKLQENPAPLQSS
jgi:hypothetical protein